MAIKRDPCRPIPGFPRRPPPVLRRGSAPAEADDGAARGDGRNRCGEQRLTCQRSPRVEGACAHVCADRKGSAAAVREMERRKRRAPRGAGEVSPASKPVKIRAAPPVFALCSYLTRSDHRICCKTALRRRAWCAVTWLRHSGWWCGKLVRASF